MNISRSKRKVEALIVSSLVLILSSCSTQPAIVIVEPTSSATCSADSTCPQSADSIPTSCASQTIAGSLTSGQVSVRVYNGGSKAGLAKSIQTQLVGKGFLVPYIGNTQEAVLQTTIVGGSADDPEVQLVAAFFPNR